MTVRPVEPFMALKDASTVAEPKMKVVIKPVASTVAIEVLDELHVAVALTFFVLLSE
jgi:hypothetical protein